MFLETGTLTCECYSSLTSKMQGAKHQLTEHSEGHGKANFELDLYDLSRCAACYNHRPRYTDHESSSSEGSGPDTDSESSSCSSSEMDFDELSTYDTSAHCTVAPGSSVLESPGPPVLESRSSPVLASPPPGSDSAERRRTNRRTVSVRSDSVLLETPKVTSVLNLQVLPPRHTYDPHYTIRRCPEDMGPSVPHERGEPSPVEPTVPVQQTPVMPLQSNVHWPQYVSLPSLLQSAPSPPVQAVHFVPQYSHTQVHYGPYDPALLHGLGSSQSYYQPLGPRQ
ncbi:hypothetical protein NL108_006219 [Boleophthalmus pectinirostris]|nr:hypothetical protein NL108_006219 [Boleophthalmus pectinirostris]